MIKILFVCHGNICRSPMAEFVMKELVEQAGLKQRFIIASAATSAEEIGNDIHWGTRKKLLAENIPFSPRSARRLTPVDYEQYDYLIGMDDANLRNMKRIFGDDPNHKIFALLDFTDHPKAIADPWYTGDFDETFSDITKGCKAFLSYLLASSD